METSFIFSKGEENIRPPVINNPDDTGSTEEPTITWQHKSQDIEVRDCNLFFQLATLLWFFVFCMLIAGALFISLIVLNCEPHVGHLSLSQFLSKERDCL